MSKALSFVGKVAGIVSTVLLLTGNPGGAAIAALASPAASHGAEIEETPMTAVSMFSDARRAYLVTDGASFFPDTGRIAWLSTKTLVFDSLSMAIAVEGAAGPVPLLDHIKLVTDKGTQHGVLKALPDAVESLSTTMREANPAGAEAGWNTLRLYVAAYDRVQAKPRLYTIASDANPAMPHLAPMELHPLKGWVTGLTSDQVRSILPAGYVSNPRTDAQRILAAQRLYPFPHIGGRCGVAGTCELFTIGRRGVSVEDVMRFPEQPGDMADPAVLGQPIAAQ